MSSSSITKLNDILIQLHFFPRYYVHNFGDIHYIYISTIHPRYCFTSQWNSSFQIAIPSRILHRRGKILSPDSNNQYYKLRLRDHYFGSIRHNVDHVCPIHMWYALRYWVRLLQILIIYLWVQWFKIIGNTRHVRKCIHRTSHPRLKYTIDNTIKITFFSRYFCDWRFPYQSCD